MHASCVVRHWSGREPSSAFGHVRSARVPCLSRPYALAYRSAGRGASHTQPTTPVLPDFPLPPARSAQALFLTQAVRRLPPGHGPTAHCHFACKHGKVCVAALLWPCSAALPSMSPALRFRTHPSAPSRQRQCALPDPIPMPANLPACPPSQTRCPRHSSRQPSTVSRSLSPACPPTNLAVTTSTTSLPRLTAPCPISITHQANAFSYA